MKWKLTAFLSFLISIGIFIKNLIAKSEVK